MKTDIKKFYQTEHFEALNQKWADILKDTGFDDIEAQDYIEPELVSYEELTDVITAKEEAA